MGNKQCCEAEMKEYQQTYPQQQQEKIKAVKVQTGEVEKKEQLPPQHSPGQKLDQAPKEENKRQHESEIQVIVEQQPVRIPQLNSNVQGILQKYNNLNELAQVNKKVKEFGKEVYVGQLDNIKNVPHGYGKIYKADGSLYLGEWSQGKAEGKGIYIRNDGSFYQGQFHNNKAHGNGKFVSSEFVYEGGFKSNKFEGQGVQKGKSYNFEGEYKDGSKSKGVLTWKSGEQSYEYNGQFNNNNQFNGQGMLREPSGLYKGEFKNGEKHGVGEYRYENGLVYRGQYQQNKKSGNGTIVNCNGTIAYQGQFEDDLPHGEGYVFDEKNKKTKRRWVRGIDVEAL